ncbi:uncharacterized protein LOC127101651 [Lathyrus oleraceus]|uniref:uncharacterized protein LOC127101651 n=1 Tax=Pisum sativum TaxID=3888 RepID=UPI0021D3C278|nr:uncharacterized protein LOC127101651 [Pisum sativum]
MATANILNNNERDHYSEKPLIFDGEKFYYWKDRIESLFLVYDVDLWDLVVDGYIHPINAEGNNIATSAMTDQQKKDFINHHEARNILLNVISYTEYEKITNKDSSKSIFYSLRMTHEGDAQVKEKKVLNSISLEELVSSLRSHEIELEEDEPQKRGKSVSLKSKPEKTKAYKYEGESEGSDKDSKDDDEFSMISKRVNKLWKHKHNGQGKLRGARRTAGRFDSSSILDRRRRKVLEKDKRPNKNFPKGKKGLMATWDDSESQEEDYDEEKENVAFRETTYDLEGYEEPKDKVLIELESSSDFEEVFSNLSRSGLECCLSELLERYQSLQSKYKDLKQVQVATSETRSELEKYISSLNEKLFSLEINNFALKSRISKLEEEVVSEASGIDYVIRYEEHSSTF